MWKIIGNVYRVLESVFRERRDGFLKCPGCNGSGMIPNERRPIRENCHSLHGQPCRFCEGHGLLPLTGLRGFLLIRTSSNLQTQDLPGPITNSFSPMSSFSHIKNKCIFTKFKPCLGLNGYPFHASKSPPWIADTIQGIMKNPPQSQENDTMPLTPYTHMTESWNGVLFKPRMMYTAFCSAGLLITLLASAISNNPADSQVISSNGFLDVEEIEHGNYESHQSGEEIGSCWKPRRHTRKRKNLIRQRAAENAEARARRIIEALVPTSKGVTANISGA